MTCHLLIFNAFNVDEIPRRVALLSDQIFYLEESYADLPVNQDNLETRTVKITVLFLKNGLALQIKDDFEDVYVKWIYALKEDNINDYLSEKYVDSDMKKAYFGPNSVRFQQ